MNQHEKLEKLLKVMNIKGTKSAVISITEIEDLCKEYQLLKENFNKSNISERIIVKGSKFTDRK